MEADRNGRSPLMATARMIWNRPALKLALVGTGGGGRFSRLLGGRLVGCSVGMSFAHLLNLACQHSYTMQPKTLPPTSPGQLLKGHLACQALIHDAAQAVHVSTFVHTQTVEQLRSHVLNRPE